ncbi:MULTISPECIES: cell division protein CdvB3 [Metallosphaera]|uniref:Uncharacterized protein n=3 Tax=Metallosphaera TaxID=41980 RepID=A4YI57_METS5|nr:MULTISPECIES: cell division protein CdvB3 [Metallosphaera]ABP96109.1 hypothetical protein Msed_1969 [Metallosphaera sedula DSM 5348]AIM28092.1 hypothetical protein HA72_1969 [Metallosphaera sedula]AKV74918.1 hypothetical protein MsedA_2019 [Metallosphaera sedula]AKV77156.1 hypothetical protein MsedB_2021 [Metallosphaera sedula]AKV79406.1 hypothetical protein MsedC_2019 [Metallosphaera sedula]
MKRDLQRLLVDVKIARGKIRLWQNRLSARAEQFKRLSANNATKFATLAEQYAKESEQLENILNYMDRLDVLLEMVELKLETLVYIDYVSQDMVNLIEALREFRRVTPLLSTELSMLLDELYSGFYASVEVPEPMRIRAREEAKTILKESENIVNSRNKTKVGAQA